MCRTIFILLLLTYSISNTFSQYYSCQNDTSKIYASSTEEKLTGRAYYPKVYINNELQYFNTWSKGEVILNDGAVVKNVYLRYDSYTDELLWLRDLDLQTAVVEKQYINGFKIYLEYNKSTAYFKKIFIENWYEFNGFPRYLQVLAEGKISLYVQRQVSLNNNTNELYQKYQYFLLKNGRFYSFKPARITLLNIMQEDKEKMKSVLRSHRLHVRKESDLIEAIIIYNALPESN